MTLPPPTPPASGIEDTITVATSSASSGPDTPKKRAISEVTADVPPPTKAATPAGGQPVKKRTKMTEAEKEEKRKEKEAKEEEKRKEKEAKEEEKRKEKEAKDKEREVKVGLKYLVTDFYVILTTGTESRAGREKADQRRRET
jgi:chromatin assembly factor 1 subunit A